MTNLYSVSYNLNNATGGSTPPTQTAESKSDTYTFVVPSAKEYGLIRSGYGFIGWSENADTTTPQYQPRDTITLSNASPNKTLYAVWTTPTTSANNWNELYFMQQMNPTACTDGNEGGKELVDSRDNKSYWVARLKDGNCWMTQNLDYDDPDGIKITSTSGDNGGPSAWSASNEDGWKDDNTRRQYWDPGEKIISGSTLTDATNSTDQHLLVGNYYSWLSATNGTAPSGSGEANGNICPDGWRLPSNNSSIAPTFTELRTAYSIGNTGSKFLEKPLYFLYGGYVYSGVLNSAGSVGYYWSSTAYSRTDAYDLRFSSSTVSPSYIDYRYYGFSVRCIAK